MPIKEIRQKIANIITDETDLTKINAFKGLDDDLAKAEQDEEAMMKSHTELLKAYKDSIIHEGSDKEPANPSAPTPAPTFDTILNRFIEANASKGK